MSGDRDVLDAGAKVIDRLLCLLPVDSEDYNAVDNALAWLVAHDHDGLWLSGATRYLMQAWQTRQPR